MVNASVHQSEKLGNRTEIFFAFPLRFQIDGRKALGNFRQCETTARKGRKLGTGAHNCEQTFSARLLTARSW